MYVVYLWMEEHQTPLIGPKEPFEFVYGQVPMHALYEFIYNLPLHKLHTLIYQRYDLMMRTMKKENRARCKSLHRC